MSALEIRPIEVAQTYPLRGSVLRPGCSIEESIFPSDVLPGALSFGAFSGGEIVGIASIFPETWTHDPALNAWRLRGMAVDPESQGRGIGAALMRACLAHVEAQRGELLWCNARSGALLFYRSLGFETVGEEFDIPDIGPHFVMFRRI